MELHIGWLTPGLAVFHPASSCRHSPHSSRLRVDSKCNVCGSASPTVLHILNSCPTSLTQGRFTGSHDSVLQRLVRGIIPALSKGMRGYILIFRTTVSAIIHLLPFPRISCLHQPIPISSSCGRRRFFY